MAAMVLEGGPTLANRIDEVERFQIGIIKDDRGKINGDSVFFRTKGKFNKIGCLLLAWPTPRGKEVEDDVATSVVVKVEGLARE